MNTSANAKDPLVWISVLLAITGGIQASTGLLSTVASEYPTVFGLVMTGISVTTAVLTVLKNQLTQRTSP